MIVPSDSLPVEVKKNNDNRVHTVHFANPIDSRHRLVESPFGSSTAWQILQKYPEGSDHPPPPLVWAETLAAEAAPNEYTVRLKTRNKEAIEVLFLSTSIHEVGFQRELR